MKHLHPFNPRFPVRAVAALALASALPTGLAQGTADLAPLVDGAGAIDPRWRVVGFPKSQREIPLTRFEPGEADGVRGVQVLADRSYGTLSHALAGGATGELRWRWRLDAPLSGGSAAPDILTKAGDDAALKVCAMFDHPLDRVPFIERQVLRLARNVSGEALPAATVCYVWDSVHPAATTADNPYSRRVRFIVLQGREAPLSRWVEERRNPAEDFRRLFADELPAGSPVPALNQVVVGADADNTGSRSAGWVADVRLAR